MKLISFMKQKKSAYNVWTSCQKNIKQRKEKIVNDVSWKCRTLRDREDSIDRTYVVPL